MSDMTDEMVEAVMVPMFRALDDVTMRDRDVVVMVIDIVLAAAPTVEERRTVRLDNEGVEWFACDPYPTWYRRVDGEVMTMTSLGDEFCGWPAAPTVTSDSAARDFAHKTNGFDGWSAEDAYERGWRDSLAAQADTKDKT